MSAVNGMPPMQNGMMHAAQHPSAAAQQQQQPGMVPVSAVQQDPMALPGTFTNDPLPAEGFRRTWSKLCVHNAGVCSGFGHC